MSEFADTLIVVALKEESGGLFEALGCPVLYTGVGKVNATYALTRALSEQPNVRFVLNLGTAGSRKFRGLDLVGCTRFVQSDMDATAFGYPHGHTPGDPPSEAVIEHPASFVFQGLAASEARLFTADHFVTTLSEDMDVVDMEGFALAKVTQRMGKEFHCVKLISDGGDSDAAESWKTQVTPGQKRLLEVLSAYLAHRKSLR